MSDKEQEISPNSPSLGSTVDIQPTEAEKILEALEAKYSVEKLEKECKFLDYQNSNKYKRIEYLKALSGIGSVLAAIVTFGAIIFSVIKWSDDNKQSRLAKDDEKFNMLISTLQDPSPQKRLNAAITLKSYVDKNNIVRNSQIILSLANGLAYDEDEISRSGSINVLRSIDFSLIDSVTLKEGLASLFELDKVLAKEAKIWAPQKNQLGNGKVIDKIVAVSEAIEIFLKRKVYLKDMSGIVLLEVDLSNIDFLPGTTFEESGIINSKLYKTSCENCNFKNSYLSGSSFVKANLPNADFSIPENKISLLGFGFLSFHEYIGPLFDSANLKGSNFSNNDLIYLGNIVDTNIIISPTFIGSNIENVNFLDCNIYSIGTVVTIAKDLKDLNISSGSGVDLPDSLTFVHWPIKSIKTLKKIDSSYLLERIPDIFYGSNWKSAKLPPLLLKLLQDSPRRYMSNE